MSIWDRLPQDRLLADVSLWSADLANLEREVRRMEPWADLFHLDASDAHFVPGLLFFPDLVAALRPHTETPLHVHLMAQVPIPLVDLFAKAGADMITVHVENGERAGEALARIRAHGRATGLALGLDTPVEHVKPYLAEIDMVLLLGTALGLKGQTLSEEACPRLRAMRRLLAAAGMEGRVRIGADGGIRDYTVPALRDAGADVVVPGSLAFGPEDPADTFEWLRALPRPEDVGRTR